MKEIIVGKSASLGLQPTTNQVTNAVAGDAIVNNKEEHSIRGRKWSDFF